MQNLYVALALFLLLNLGVDMWRVLRGPTSADRMLAALVPKPRVNLTRFRGVFAPNSKHRVLVTPARQGKGNKPDTADDMQEQTPAERRA